MKSRRLFRVLRSLWPWRYLVSVRWLTHGVRVHPSSCFLAGLDPVQIGPGASIGARCRIDLGADGRLVLGERVWISGDVEFETEGKIEVGAGTTIQRRCTVNGNVRIGVGCIFAPNVFVSSGTHPFRLFPHLPIREQERRVAAGGKSEVDGDRAVWIQDDCWLGANVVVCPGVIVGKGSVVGANAVVTRDVRPYTVVAGAPSQPIGKRLDWRPGRSVRADCETDQIYRIAGKIGSLVNGNADCFEIDVDTPLCVALSCAAAAAKLVIHWQAPIGVQFEAAGQAHRVSAGNGVLEIAADVSQAADGVFYCWFKLREPTSGAVLRLSRIDIEAIDKV